MPKCLVERFNVDTLNYIAESKTENGKHYLGTLAGPAAEFVKATRNGRLYNLKLWRNVEASEDFKEGMETLTILGETDHPDDRLETKIKEVAIVLRKFEIRENEGIVWCESDILDTPNGRILKELLDYGCKIGVSSRGSGEEIVENGETIIDPETYFFICFDAVITPAVEKARPEIVEGVVSDNANKSNLLVESIKKEISNATTSQELESIKSIISATGLPELKSIKESIDDKLNSIGNGDNISSKLIKELGESATKIEELESEIEFLRNVHTADNIRMKEMRELIKSMKSNSKNLRECLQDAKKQVSILEDDIVSMTEQSSEYDESLESLREEVTRLKSDKRTLKLKVSKLESAKASRINELQDKLVESRRTANENSGLYEDVRRENSRLKNKLSEASTEIDKYKTTERKLTAKAESLRKNNDSLIKENKLFRTRYLQMKAVQCGFSSETVRSRLPENYSISDVDRVVSELSDKKDRINKIPVAIPVSGISINESKAYDGEDEEISHTVEMLKQLKGIK